VPGFLHQRGGRIEILERIPDGNDQAVQQIKRSGRIAGSEADLCESQEVGRDKSVLFNLAGKDQFEDFARRLLVAGFKQTAGSGAEDLGSGSFLRLRTI
jgi:hypothetical protein